MVVLSPLVDAKTLVHAAFASGKRFQFRLGMLYKFPVMRKQLDTLVEKSQKQEPNVSLTVEVPGSETDFLAVYQHVVENAARLPSLYFVYKRFGVSVDGIQRESLLHLTNPRLVHKTEGHSGAIISLCATGVQQKFVQVVGVRETYFSDHGTGVPDGIYSISQTSYPVRVVPGGAARVPLSRNGDLWECMTLKLLLKALPEGVLWKADVVSKLLHKLRLEIGGNTNEEMSGQANLVLAQQYQLYPKRANRYEHEPFEFQRQRSSNPWLVTIPICFSNTVFEASALRAVCLPYQEALVSFEFGHASDLVHGDASHVNIEANLEVDNVFLDTETRQVLAQTSAGRPVNCVISENNNRATPETELDDFSEFTAAHGDKGEVSTVLPSPSPSPVLRASNNLANLPRPVHEQIFQMVYETEWIDAKHASKISLPFSNPLSGVLLMVEMEDSEMQQCADLHPFLSAKLTANGHTSMEGDIVDLSEYNWLRTKGVKPESGKTYLLPLSRHCFERHAPALLNTSRVDHLDLHLTPNDSVLPNWRVKVVGLTRNVRVYDSGMAAPKFAH